MPYIANNIQFKIAKIRDPFTDVLVLIEETTDVIYLQIRGGSITPMLDPKTGLPLTYKVWKEKYDK